MLCPTCGADLPEDEALCANCGAAPDAQPAPEAIPEAVEDSAEESAAEDLPAEESVEEPAEEAVEETAGEPSAESEPEPIPAIAPLPEKKKSLGKLIAIIAAAVVALGATAVILFFALGGGNSGGGGDPEAIAVKAMNAQFTGDLLEVAKYNFLDVERCYKNNKEFRDGLNAELSAAIETTDFKEFAKASQAEYMAEAKEQYGEDFSVTFTSGGVEYLKDDAFASWLEEYAPAGDYEAYFRGKWSDVKEVAMVSIDACLHTGGEDYDDVFNAYLVKVGAAWYFYYVD